MKSKRVYVTYDPAVDAGYVYFQKAAARKSGSSKRAVRVTEDIIIDFDSHDRIVGIEFLKPRTQLQKTWWRDRNDRKR